MNKRGVSYAIVLAAFAASIAGAACVTSENRCVSGFAYLPEYKACVPEADASVGDASDAATAVTSDASTDDGGTPGTSGLGDACNGDPDCAGKKASYCLKDPLAPNDPGICSVPQCSPADCGETHACCDCGAAAVPELQAWPRRVCAPRSDTPTLQSFGCVCP